MKFRNIISIIIFFLAVQIAIGQVQRPNIVLIMADDMGYEALGCNGSLSYSTPHLDNLANRGIRFTNCFSQPLCTPSRVKLMTGKYNFRNYEDFGYLNPKERTIGNLMKDAGYITCISGKWQLNGLNRNNKDNQDVYRPFDFGFDEYCLWQVHHARSEGERYANPQITKNGRDLPRNEDAYGPELFCDFIVDFIDKYSKQPFFIYYPMVLVHDPFVPTPDLAEWSVKSIRYENDTAYFKDMVAYTDKIVHRIELKLKEAGVWENTIFIFTADNGTHPSITTKTIYGDVQGGKGLSINTGNHVPMIATWPAVNQRRGVYNGIIGFEDFFPTLANAAGVGPNQFDNDGTSFLRAIAGSTEPIQSEIFIHYSPRWGENKHNRWVMDGSYKLYQDGRFFNTLIDPLEEYPLMVLSDNQKGIKQRFKQILTEKENEFPFRLNDQ
ncbi:MAG: sulfatase-like hydrolase/transferase [Mariniphaga sp.]|nr:sulfatase-like hydrolase/transferase [Mariniphaga sp.]